MNDTANSQKSKAVKKPKTSISTVDASSSKVRKLKWKPTLILSAFIIAVISLLISSYIWTRLVTIKHLEQTVQQQLTNIQTQKENIDQIKQQIQQLQQGVTSLNNKINTNEANIQQISDMTVQDNQSVILRNVKHLLQLAQLNLHFDSDISSALALLQTAQKYLSQLNAPRTLQLRQHLQSIISQLQSWPQINKTDLLVQLNALSLQVVKLPITSHEMTQGIKILPKDSALLTGWHKYWQQSLDAISQVIVIRYQEQPVLALISPKQQASLATNIQQKFSQASWAVLHNNQTVFINSLETANQWIEQYYATDSKATKQVLNMIEQLKKTHLIAPKVDIAHSIEMIDALLKNAGNK